MPIIKNGDYSKIKTNKVSKLDLIADQLSSEPTTKNINYFKKLEKSKSSKAKLIKDVDDTLKMIESIKIPKKTKSKDLSKVISITEMMVKTPKTKKINTMKASKEIDDIHAEIDKLLKAPKKDLKKLVQADKEHLKYHPSKQDYKEMKMDQKAYKHKVKDVSPLVQHYVNQFKAILDENKTKGGTMTKQLNKLRDNFYYTAKPSEIDDANALIKEYRELLPKKEIKEKVKKSKTVKPEDNSYKGDKKYKPLTEYVKKHKPHITDTDDIHMIVSEIIDKKIPRMSVKKLDEILKDLGYEISGEGVHYDDSDTSSGSSSDYE